MKKMLASRVIRPSQGFYSSPVLLLRKIDGSCRLCIDYRGLNEITIKKKFPIIVVKELMDELQGVVIFYKLDLGMDLRSHYNQISFKPTNIHNNAFRTHKSHYEIVVILFRLINPYPYFKAL